MAADPLVQTIRIADRFSVNDLDEASATITYVGYEAQDGHWYIKKLDETSGLAVGHATRKNNTSANVASYTNAWTNRATLTYTDISLAF